MFYVVWAGRKCGIFSSWTECEACISGFPGARFKGFASRVEAENAYKSGPPTKKVTAVNYISKSFLPRPNGEAVCVDAAWNTKTGVMEYRGVTYPGGKEIFHKGPFEDGTNNIGEFLAIVHALALLKKKNSSLPVYSDSHTAITWVKNKNPKTKLEPSQANEELFELLNRAHKWLRENEFQNTLRKWETKIWGEIPADFGRKK